MIAMAAIAADTAVVEEGMVGEVAVEVVKEVLVPEGTLPCCERCI